MTQQQIGFGKSVCHSVSPWPNAFRSCGFQSLLYRSMRRYTAPNRAASAFELSFSPSREAR